jgi:plastocyanin
MHTVLSIAALLIAALTAHSSSLTTRSGATIAIRTFQFAPDTVRVKPGTRVTWTNADEIEHTITSGTSDTPDGRFSGVVAKRDATFSATLERAGTYAYFCDRHRFMKGTVIVSQ